LLAQDAVLGQIYGNGVHAYFGQDYMRAYQLFTSAIDGSSQDPRCFYFRGLALLKLGRPQDAAIDFQHGAKLESSVDSARSFNIARSLERVQGSDRSALEQYRLEARMLVLQKAENENRIRYQEGLKEQRAFLQKASEGAPAKTVEASPEVVRPVEVPGETVKPAGPAVPTPPPANPFSTGEEGKATEMKKEGVVPAAPVKPEVPAEGGLKPDAPVLKPDAVKPDAVKPDASNPFADTPAAKPDAVKPDAAKPVDNAANPFSDAVPAKPATPVAPAKPDAAKPDAAKPAAEKPDAKAVSGDNPFAEEPPAKAAQPPAAPTSDKKPADAKKPADEKKPADDNPFSG
jgi:hypothetical protein